MMIDANAFRDRNSLTRTGGLVTMEAGAGCSPPTMLNSIGKADWDQKGDVSLDVRRARQTRMTC